VQLTRSGTDEAELKKKVEFIDAIRNEDDPVFLVHELLTPLECQLLIEAAETAGE